MNPMAPWMTDRSKGRSPRQIPGNLAGMFLRVPKSGACRVRILRRSPPWRPILADELPHEEVRDPEEPEPHEDQCGQGHCGGYPDAKFCHEVPVLPGALTLRERDMMLRLIEVSSTSRGRILRRSPPRRPIEADVLICRGDEDSGDARGKASKIRNAIIQPRIVVVTEAP